MIPVVKIAGFLCFVLSWCQLFPNKIGVHLHLHMRIGQSGEMLADCVRTIKEKPLIVIY